MKTLKALLLSFAMLHSLASFSQEKKQAADQNRFTKSELKKVEKSKALYNKNKFGKAIAMISTVQQTHLLNEELWSLRIAYEYQNYLLELFSGKFTSDKEEKLLSACRQATLYCENQENASMDLRAFLVDKNVDDDVSKDAKEEFQLGETAFRNEKYESAARHYKEAYKADTTYYKAALYVGDAYFRDKEYELALPWYQKAVNMQPNLLEGRKYLTDVFIKMHKWKEAYDACLDAIVVYPDVGMFIKLQTIAEELDKKYDRHWIPRFYFPNQIGKEQASIPTSPWSYYRDVKPEVYSKCNGFGIISGKPESLKYLEVYSWTKMLEQAKENTDELEFARKMNKEGYLDCYVFVSLFHISIYDQYADFAKYNADRIKKYISTYIVN